MPVRRCTSSLKELQLRNVNIVLQFFTLSAANLVDKLATDANSAIESQAKKVEELGSQADLSEDNASNLVDKIGK